MTTPQEAVSRARGALGHTTIYKLGAGGMNPNAPVPWNERGECDCSGFYAWCIGLSRHTSFPWYAAYNGGWLETTAIVKDARSTNGFFDEVVWEQALPGDAIVYGDADGHQGHMGIVVEVAAGHGPVAVVHCSLGNWRTTHDAIREAPPSLWRMHDGLIARCALLTQGLPVA